MVQAAPYGNVNKYVRNKIMGKGLLNKRLFLSMFLSVSSLCFILKSLHAETLLIGVGLSKPPYIIQEKNTGVEYEVVERALQIAGYEMKPRYMPLLRIVHELNGGTIDGGMTMRKNMKIDAFLSDIVMVYQNFAITREDTKLVLKNLNDLSNISVLAFQNAQNLLGADFKTAIGKNHKYTEIANQALQVKMLETKRTDVVVADFRIFLHFKKQLELKENLHFNVKFHRLFEPTSYRVGFKNETVRDKFDQGLAVLKETGEYDRILAKYISPDDMKRLLNVGPF
jgi:polar amino acid transport system substrate-binding protein